MSMMLPGQMKYGETWVVFSNHRFANRTRLGKANSCENNYETFGSVVV